jgi:hyperosmotically inducible protein
MKNLLNRSLVGIAALLIGLAGCAGKPTQDSTGQYIDDASITTKVKSEMVADKAMSAVHISVDTIKGVVHLTGTADTRPPAENVPVTWLMLVWSRIQVKPAALNN